MVVLHFIRLLSKYILFGGGGGVSIKKTGLSFGNICQFPLSLTAPLDIHIHNTASPCFTIERVPNIYSIFSIHFKVIIFIFILYNVMCSLI